MESVVIMQFGSRSGSWLALLLFGATFAGLAVLIVAGLARAAELRKRTAWASGATMFVSLAAAFYWSTLSGFYELRLVEERVTLSYLHPLSTDLALDDISSVRTGPAHKGTWRLYVEDRSGTEYASATARRDVVDAAAAALRTALDRRR